MRLALVAVMLPWAACRAEEALNPALKALADESKVVAVVDVLETSPRKAIEGARDTVRLKVVRSLKGGLAAGQTVGVYYHLIWIDIDKHELEPPKFEKGKRYIVFLKGPTAGDDGRGNPQYEPADQWLSVQRWHPELERDVKLAAGR